MYIVPAVGQLPGQHLIEQQVCFPFLLLQLSSPVLDDLLKVVCVLLHQLEHVVHNIYVSVKK